MSHRMKYGIVAQSIRFVVETMEGSIELRDTG